MKSIFYKQGYKYQLVKDFSLLIPIFPEKYISSDFIIVEGIVVDIQIKKVKGKRLLPAKELKEFKNFVEKFKIEIVQKWVDYFVCHKSIKCIKIEGKVK